jgi:sortase (surface protein transpeptidase)
VNATAARRAGLGILIPAVAAAVLAFALFPRSERSPPGIPAGQAHPPRQLARIAGAASEPLHPIVLHGSRAELGSGPAGTTTASDRPAEPAHLSIPALGVRADVQRVGATTIGLEVPQVGRAGWFDEGARPGEPGRAVIIGHLDSQTGPGLFALLPGVHNGTDVSVTDARGAVHRFQVVGKAQVPKATFPSAAVYGASSRPVLVLITCGGPYTEGSGYRDNVIVYARGVS